MAVFTPFRAFNNATPIGGGWPAASRPRLIAYWSVDDGRLVRHWRAVAANELIAGRLGQ